MRYRIKLVVLVATALLSMGAFMAAGGQAANFTASSYPAIVTGEQPAGSPHEFIIQGQKVTCTKAHFAGVLKGASESITIEPTYEGCTAFGFANSKVHMNGCDFEFTVGNGTTGSVHIRCPVGQSITITAPSSASPPCVVHIPPQTPTTNVVDFEKTGGNNILFTWTVEGFHSSVTKNNFLCPMSANSTDSTGIYEGLTWQQALGGASVDIG